VNSKRPKGQPGTTRLETLPKRKAEFIEPMDRSSLQAAQWTGLGLRGLKPTGCVISTFVAIREDAK
jgi:hypothetical protein